MAPIAPSAGLDSAFERAPSPAGRAGSAWMPAAPVSSPIRISSSSDGARSAARAPASAAGMAPPHSHQAMLHRTELLRV